MNGAKMMLHSSNSGNLRGARTASSLLGQGAAQENLHCRFPRSTSPSSPRAFFHSIPSKPENNTLRESSLDNRDEPSCSSVATSTSSQVHVSSCSSASTTSTPSSTPLLLLEGDNYHISHDGVARTLYRMRRSGAQRAHTSLLPSGVFTVEELYDLSHAKKKFVLRRDCCNPALPIQPAAECVIRVGETIQEVDLQEIEAGVLGGAGTGATTWESSIVMAMHFACRPEMLLGDVVELGSGVGLGGILCALGPRILPVKRGATMPTNSFTLTDANAMVLEQCRENIERIQEVAGVTLLRVSKLDWYDFLQHSFEKPSVPNQLFDTIIACDCAYRHRDIAALAATMTSLLRDEHSRIHIFGPNNRSGLDELLTLLRENYQLSVKVQPVEMERYRLRLLSKGDLLSGLVDSIGEENECHAATSSVSRFLHVTCSPMKGPLETDENLLGID